MAQIVCWQIGPIHYYFRQLFMLRNQPNGLGKGIDVLARRREGFIRLETSVSKMILGTGKS